MDLCLSPRLRAVLLAGLSALLPLSGVGQAARSGGPQVEPSRLDLYGGYAYFHPVNSDIGEHLYNPMQPGAIASVTGFFSPYIGIQAEGTFFPKSDGYCMSSAQAGPVFRYQYGRLVPFAHALAGEARISGPVNQPCTLGWAVTGGIGFDYILPGFGNHLALRPVQADFHYSQVDYGPLIIPGTSGGLGEIYAYRLSGGIVGRFGSMGKPVSLELGCTTQPAAVYPGDPMTVNAATLNLRDPAKYQYLWSASGGRVTGTDSSAAVNTAALAPGDYTVRGALLKTKSGKQVATCTAGFTVKAYDPPTLSCSADPSTVLPGAQVIVRTSGVSPQNRTLTYSYQTTGGQITSNGATATLQTGGANPGPISVTCNVTDDLGKTATAIAMVNVTVPPVAVAPQARQLCALAFDRDRRRPDRVDNEAKGCLDDIGLTMNRETGAKLLIIGHHSPGETDSNAAERALNVREYLVVEKGIDVTRIEMRIGEPTGRSVENTLIPPGASYDPGAVSAFDAETVPRHGQAYGKPAPAKRTPRRKTTQAPAAGPLP